ncbi:glycosyltransferase family 2 protein [Microbacterium sp. 1262]|uniref:glycosyltransferase family 2 protein n=1 Tax=Microbacterium sp. 1262 TaxID=3156415 RepID=UPI0033956A1F
MTGRRVYPPAGGAIESTVISIATFRRPDLLRSLLARCVEQIGDSGRRVRIVVVDNDPGQSAKDVVSEFSSVEYLPEPKPGIAAARNRGLDALEAEDQAIVFIDDDEIPASGWFSALVAYAEETNADVVTGPVEPLIDDRVPTWIVRGGFWRRHNRETGAVPDSVATNNTLLRLAAWRQSGIRFSEALSMKGGSDTEFFRAIRARAALTVLWCAEAVVEEHVLPQRANARWLFRRAIRIGNINARYRGRVAALLGGVARIGIGAPYVALDFILHRQPMARSWNMLAHGIGMVGNVVRFDVVEYRRTTSGA